jgi:hypothetical protein
VVEKKMVRHLVDPDHWLDRRNRTCVTWERKGWVRYRPDLRVLEVQAPPSAFRALGRRPKEGPTA